MKRGIKLQCSEHAKNRIKERLGVTDKAQIKQLTKDAYHKGMCMKRNFIPKETLTYITRKVQGNYFNRCSQWRIYEGNLFLYSKTLTLVTVYGLPSHLVPRKKMKRFE